MRPLHIIIAVLVLAIIGYVGYRSNKTLVDGFPPKDDTSLTALEARDKALTVAGGESGRILSVAGTGSMAPYIQAAPPGRDPYGVVVAYVVIRKGAGYADIEVGDLCVYRPQKVPAIDPNATPAARKRQANALWLHQAAQKDGDGWIMTGYANKNYESWTRVTPRNFVGIVEKTFVWSQ